MTREVRENKSARIDRDGQYLIIRPPCPELLAGVQTVRQFAVSDPEHGYRVAAVPVPFVQLGRDWSGQPVMSTWPALEPVVSRVLTAAGYAVQRRGSGPPALAPPDRDELRTFGRVDEALLEHVRQHDRGLIRYAPGGVQVSRLVAQVALGWPGLNIAVVAKREREVLQLCGALRQYTPDLAVSTCRHYTDAYRRIAIATPHYLCRLEMERRDVVIVLDAAEFVAPQYLKRMVLGDHARLYGLLPAGARPAPRERDRIAAVFGLRHVVIPGHGYRELPVDVAWLRIRGGPALAGEMNLVELKRRGLWRHRLRNRLVARLAQVLQGGSRDEVEKLLPALTGYRLAPPPRRVVLLVETLEHALQMSQRCDIWPIVTGPDVWKQGLGDRERHALGEGSARAAGGAVPAVVTATGMGAVDLRTVDVLVRADGGVGLPPTPQVDSLDTDDPGRRLLLVDCNDGHHPVLRRHSRHRREAYRERGWLEVGADPLQAAVERFLAARPPRRNS